MKTDADILTFQKAVKVMTAPSAEKDSPLLQV